MYSGVWEEKGSGVHGEGGERAMICLHLWREVREGRHCKRTIYQIDGKGREKEGWGRYEVTCTPAIEVGRREGKGKN